jgi:hypothetical protein|tara:strand:- start:632 stop:1027 length:396 start_codon:yes stop_codon:yes gene_type:complete
MKDRDDEIHIKLRKGGWEIEITCTEDKIKQSVESVLSGLNTSIVEIPTANGKQVRKGNLTCRGLIEGMWREGWFIEERNLSDVHEELARRGYHYDRTAVSHALTDLVRENTLTRVGMMRSYRYIQKKPSSS